MIVILDNVTTPWYIPPKWLGSPDRAWIEVPQPSGLPFGTHLLSFALNVTQMPPLREQGRDKTVKQICSVEVSEYGREDDFERSDGFVGAFPTSVPHPLFLMREETDSSRAVLLTLQAVNVQHDDVPTNERRLSHAHGRNVEVLSRLPGGSLGKVVGESEAYR